MKTTTEIKAISCSAWTEFGCPLCGYSMSSVTLSISRITLSTSQVIIETELHICLACRNTFLVLEDGRSEPTIETQDGFQQLTSHPRKGTPSHDKLKIGVF